MLPQHSAPRPHPLRRVGAALGGIVILGGCYWFVAGHAAWRAGRPLGALIGGALGYALYHFVVQHVGRTVDDILDGPGPVSIAPQRRRRRWARGRRRR